MKPSTASVSRLTRDVELPITQTCGKRWQRSFLKMWTQPLGGFWRITWHFPMKQSSYPPASDLRVTYQRVGTGSETNICRHVDDTALPPAQPNSFVLLRVEIIGVVGRFAADMFDPINSCSTSTRSSLW